MAQPDDGGGSGFLQAVLTLLTGGGLFKLIDFVRSRKKEREQATVAERALELKAREVADVTEARTQELLRQHEILVWERTQQALERAEARADRFEKRVDEVEERVRELEEQLEAAHGLIAEKDRQIQMLQSDNVRLTLLTVEQSAELTRLQQDRNALKLVAEDLEAQLILARSGVPGEKE